jgi:REP element-mobilizing transposase RayT
MPRQARLDAPETLHHVIVRGIERREIVDDDKDRENFVNRMGTLASETDTAIYAWALLTNHAHILLRSGALGLSKYMKRLLTGYAVSYNRRHGRHGHLFQNRYKSIVVEEDSYFQELVRYIHLNPLRAKMTDSLAQLDRYSWCGHSVILGRLNNDWQDTEYVLKWFGKKTGEAKRVYRQFVKSGIAQGHRSDLVGGGLIRSQGGWLAVKEMRREGVREKSDERILGSGDFVQHLLQQSDEARRKQFSGREGLRQAIELIEGVCKDEGIDAKALRAGSRRQNVSKVRARLVEKLVVEFGLSLAEAGRQLGVSSSAVAKTLSRRNAKGN